MSAAIGLRGDYDAGALRAAAKRLKEGPQARRLLALAAIYDGVSRTEAARISGVGLQVVRDWVARFNAHGPRRPDRSQGAGAASAARRNGLTPTRSSLSEKRRPEGRRSTSLLSGLSVRPLEQLLFGLLSLPERLGSDFGQGREQVVDHASGVGRDFDGDGHARG